MPQTTAKKLLLSILIADLGLLAVLGFLWWRNFTAATALRTAERELASAEAKKEGLTEMEALIAATKNDRVVLTSSFIASGQETDFIDSLESLAREAGVKIELSGAEAGERLKLNVNISGNFPNLYRFLSLVENLPDRLRVETLDLRNMTGKDGNAWAGDFVLAVDGYLKDQ